MKPTTGFASVVIERAPAGVFEAIADITRMGDWSPENTAALWVGGPTGPETGARFDGANEAKAGPFTLKKWTTVSEISEFRPLSIFEFVTEKYTVWRFEFISVGDATQVTQTCSYPPYVGLQKLVYETLGRRSTSVSNGMQKTLDRIKAALES